MIVFVFFAKCELISSFLSALSSTAVRRLDGLSRLAQVSEHLRLATHVVDIVKVLAGHGELLLICAIVELTSLTSFYSGSFFIPHSELWHLRS